MTERVKVDPKDIKVGDLIEVEYRGTLYTEDELVTTRGRVVRIRDDGWFYTKSNSFFSGDKGTSTYFKVVEPVPDEPTGLGAVVELTLCNGTVRRFVRIHNLVGHTWDSLTDSYMWSNIVGSVIEDGSQLTVLSQGLTDD